MKRLFLFLAAIAVLSACKGPEGPMGPAGENGKDAHGPDWFKTSITVQAHEWELRGGNSGELNTYYTVYKPISAFNQYVYNNASVIAYIETEPGIKNGMPFVLHMGEEYNGIDLLWTQTYDFDFDDGGVGFYITYSDFQTQIRPGTETFHIVMLW